MEELLQKLEKGTFSVEDDFALSKIISLLINSEDTNDREQGRNTIIIVLDNLRNVPSERHVIWKDLVEAAGFYPYLNNNTPLKVKDSDDASLLIRNTYHKSNHTDKIFHAEQKVLSDVLLNGKNLIVSAPTSFGKSLLIEEIIASGIYKNIVVIQPTLALLDETRIKLKKYSADYKIIVRTSQPFSEEKGNIFLLTAERVIEYVEMPKIDLLVLDEFYKLSSKRDDKRSAILNNAFLKLVKGQGCKFYMLGPNIDEIPKGFAEKYEAVFFQTNYSLVVNESIDKYDDIKTTRGLIDENDLYAVLDSMGNEQTLIFCSSPNKARKLAFGYYNHLKKNNRINAADLPLIQWIDENISADWSLKYCLSAGIAIHDGTLQKHITTSIIQYFNNKKINFIFCTTTIIEGVNTSAKNVIFYDDKIFDRKLDYFDYSNIRGRAGRLMEHYTGKIINLRKPPEKERMIIDIPFFDQENIEDEVLVNLDKDEIKDIKDNKQRYEDFNKLEKDLQDVLKNNGVSIKSQVEILEIIKNDLCDINKRDLIVWMGIPSDMYNKFLYLFDLCWMRLATRDETSAIYNSKWLAFKTKDFCTSKGIDRMITDEISYRFRMSKKKNPTQDDMQSVIDEAVEKIFRLYRSWFQYKIPKWLRVLNSLQEYACLKKGIKPGSYKFLAEQIENEFTSDNLRILLEYGIPSSAVQKLSNTNVPEHYSEDQILATIKRNIDKFEKVLTRYEIDTIKRSL